eukprot:1160201-Pelagomonas_calceolata.AAC.2
MQAVTGLKRQASSWGLGGAVPLQEQQQQQQQQQRQQHLPAGSDPVKNTARSYWHSFSLKSLKGNVLASELSMAKPSHGLSLGRCVRACVRVCVSVCGCVGDVYRHKRAWVYACARAARTALPAPSKLLNYYSTLEACSFHKQLLFLSPASCVHADFPTLHCPQAQRYGPVQVWARAEIQLFHPHLAASRWCRTPAQTDLRKPGPAVTRINSVFDAARALRALRAKPLDTYNTHAEDAASFKYTLYKQVCVGPKIHFNLPLFTSTQHSECFLFRLRPCHGTQPLSELTAPILCKKRTCSVTGPVVCNPAR